MPRPDPTPIHVHPDGTESHESWAVIRVNRSTGGGGHLFQSSIPHQQHVTLSITPANRRRDLHTDWVHPILREYIEVTMSPAQWASVVSSFGIGEGTPVTVTRHAGTMVPAAADDEPRLARTSREVADAANTATTQMRSAANAVAEGFARKAGRTEMASLIARLTHAARSVSGDMKFAADTLTEHAEKVVEQTRADIEAAVVLGEHYRTAVAPATEAQELTAGNEQ